MAQLNRKAQQQKRQPTKIQKDFRKQYNDSIIKGSGEYAYSGEDGVASKEYKTKRGRTVRVDKYSPSSGYGDEAFTNYWYGDGGEGYDSSIDAKAQGRKLNVNSFAKDQKYSGRDAYVDSLSNRRWDKQTNRTLKYKQAKRR